MKKKNAIILTLFCAGLCFADPNVPAGFVAEKTCNRLDGMVPRLEAIADPNYGYGTGIVSARVANGFLEIYRVSDGTLELIASKTDLPDPDGFVIDVKFDKTGLFDNKLYLTFCADRYESYLYQILPDGQIIHKTNIGSLGERVWLTFDFTDGEGGYTPGCYLEDIHATGGTNFFYMDTDFTLEKLYDNLLPEGRTDMDIWAVEFDRTGLYGYYLTIADSDANHNEKTAIYQLLPDPSDPQKMQWRTLSEPIDTDIRYYGDICFSTGGAFGQMLYVTDRVTNTVMTVDPDGTHEVFAENFIDVNSITIDAEGDFMYVSDQSGIWKIMSDGQGLRGPQIIMQEPKVPADDVFTGESGVTSVRFLWDDTVEFSNEDIEILNQNSEQVPFDALGSGSEFMIITFGEQLLYDRYTITINDTVVSAATGNAIDGDQDGLTGGDAVIVIEHRQRQDTDNDNGIDFADFAQLADKWLCHNID
jgi:hypothetical protein